MEQHFLAKSTLIFNCTSSQELLTGNFCSVKLCARTLRFSDLVSIQKVPEITDLSRCNMDPFFIVVIFLVFDIEGVFVPPTKISICDMTGY